MNNRLTVSLVAASLLASTAAFAQSTTATGAVNGARAGGEVAGPVGEVVGGTVGAAVGAGLEIPNAVITSIQGERAISLRGNPRGTRSREDFLCQDALTLDRPFQSDRGDEADKGRERIHREVFKPRMPSRSPDLQDFDDTDHHDRNRWGEQPMSGIGQTKCQSDENEGDRVLAVLTEV